MWPYFLATHVVFPLSITDTDMSLPELEAIGQNARLAFTT